jgi:hypothetical protein
MILGISIFSSPNPLILYSGSSPSASALLPHLPFSASLSDRRGSEAIADYRVSIWDRREREGEKAANDMIRSMRERDIRGFRE